MGCLSTDATIYAGLMICGLLRNDPVQFSPGLIQPLFDALPVGFGSTPASLIAQPHGVGAKLSVTGKPSYRLPVQDGGRRIEGIGKVGIGIVIALPVNNPPV